jgi:SAM-dependent methyltransferase
MTGGLRFLDPGCGPDARFAEEAYKRGFSEVVAVDTQPLKENSAISIFIDYQNKNYLSEFATEKNFDVICGNPPFSQAEKFVRRSLHILKPDGVLCFILRVGFLESKDRIQFYNDRRNMPGEVLVMQQRPSFYKESGIGPTDGTAYAYFLWDGEMINRALRGVGVRSVIDVISWR